MSDLQVAESLFQYSTRLNSIQSSLEDLKIPLAVADGLVNVEGVYEGEARAELAIFFQSYSANLQKLAYYYSLAPRYLGMVIQTMADADQAVADWIEQLTEQYLAEGAQQ